MADRKQNGKNNKRRNNGDEDFNPRFRKVRKKVCVMCSNKDFVLDLFGLKLYFDDVLILSLLFFLYKEEVKDEGLFLALVLLLIS